MVQFKYRTRQGRLPSPNPSLDRNTRQRGNQLVTTNLPRRENLQQRQQRQHRHYHRTTTTSNILHKNPQNTTGNCRLGLPLLSCRIGSHRWMQCLLQVNGCTVPDFTLCRPGVFSTIFTVIMVRIALRTTLLRLIHLQCFHYPAISVPTPSIL